MNVKKIGMGAAALASVAAIGFAGTAQAATAVNEVPTAPNQVCGNVYQGSWVENGPPPGTAVARDGVNVTATLYDKNNKTVLSKTAATNTTGGYCITDTTGTLASTVTDGGYVQLAVALPTGVSLTGSSQSPWKSTGFLGSNKIGALTFAAHGYTFSGSPLPTSAYQFHFATT